MIHAAPIRPVETYAPPTRWVALYCNIRCELRAANGLRDQGLEVYVPMSRRWVKPRHAPDWRQVSRPAFTRYIFVKMADVDWFKVRATDGVESAVCVQGVPMTIPDVIIESMQCDEECGHYDDNSRAPVPKMSRKALAKTLKIGTRVVFLAGPFHDMQAEVARVAGGVLTVELMQRAVRVPVDMVAIVA